MKKQNFNKFYQKAKIYGINEYNFDSALTHGDNKHDIFERVKHGERKGRIIGLNHENFKKACQNLLRKLEAENE